MTALVQALKAQDRAAMLAVLGDAGEWFPRAMRSPMRDARSASSPLTTRNTRSRSKAIRRSSRSETTITVRVPAGQGRRALALRHCGRQGRAARAPDGQNEIYTINVVQAIVDAQRDYASADRNGDGVLVYAQKFASSQTSTTACTGRSKRVSRRARSAVVATPPARATEGKGQTPFHGYYYKMLKGQGKGAESGALDYVVKGRAIGGFAVVAYPAQCANSGIMTFIVNQDGKVFQSDLGRDTQAKASAMQRFDPGRVGPR